MNFGLVIEFAGFFKKKKNIGRKMKEELFGSPEQDKPKAWNLKRVQELRKVPTV